MALQLIVKEKFYYSMSSVQLAYLELQQMH